MKAISGIIICDGRRIFHNTSKELLGLSKKKLYQQSIGEWKNAPP